MIQFFPETELFSPQVVIYTAASIVCQLAIKNLLRSDRLRGGSDTLPVTINKCVWNWCISKTGIINLLLVDPIAVLFTD